MNLAEQIKADSGHRIDVLYKAFLQLNDYEQCLLSALAVIYKPIGVSKLAKVMHILCAQGVLTGKAKNYQLSTEAKNKLSQSGFIIQGKDGLRIHPLLANRLILQINELPISTDISNKLLAFIMAAEQVVPVVNSYSWQQKSEDEQRLARDLYFLAELNKFEQCFEFNKNPQIIDHKQNQALLSLLFLPFDLKRFLRLSNAIQYQAFATLIRNFQSRGISCAYPIALLEQVCAAHTDAKGFCNNMDCQHLLAEQYLYQMRFDEFVAIQASEDQSCYGLQLLGAYSFLIGDNKAAIDYFAQAIVAKNKFGRRKKQYLHGLLGYFYKLALIVQANKGDIQAFETALNQVEFETADRKVYCELSSLAYGLSTVIRSLSDATGYNSHIQYNSVSERLDYFCHQLDYLTHLLGLIWCNQSHAQEHAELAKTHQGKFMQLDYPLFAAFCEQLSASVNRQTMPDNTIHSFGLIDISQQIKAKSPWDIALDKLIALNPTAEHKPAPIESAPVKPIRLIWELKEDYEYSLQAREQTRSKSGWTKGRIVSLKRLKTDIHSFDYLSESDKQICRNIIAHQGWGYYAKTDYSLNGLSALEAAVGIDNLYLEGDFVAPIELIKREPALLVTQQGVQLCLSMADLPDDVAFNEDDNYRARKTQSAFSLKHLSHQRYQLTVFLPDHIKVAKIIGEDGLLIPESAKQKALDSIAAIAPLLNIQSDMTELDTGLETQDCDPHLMVNIEPTKSGLDFSCVVMPFGEQGPAFIPGLGNASLSTEINGKRIATARDLVREQGLLDALDKNCPLFLQMSGNRLLLDDLQTALVALEQLEGAIAHQSLPLILRWPRGKTIRLSRPLESQHLQLALSKTNEWFDIGGKLQIDDEHVIELRKLLELVKTSHGRFIELGSEQILALSEDLRHKLEQINQVTDDGQFHPLASLKIEEATSGMRMKTLHAWDEQSARMRQANNIEPKLPSTFQAQLRDYQIAGFDWGIRLAHWGAGACLADDMGLGKTLQALAIVLARANAGPSLVIAPTSVCLNWQQEALKFTPTLNIILFADASNTDARETLLKGLNNFDCVIISYGLLQRESDILNQVHWQTIVADEAQALKNPLAKRTKAAYALKADFKMITTGTPIENDLTELWSLFRFINPGLLGNLKRFVKRFVVPMSNAKDDPLAARKASQALKALIQPFILRRMKNQVLTELPPRTEITLPVMLSTKEQSFYEALRLNAIDNITQSTDLANTGEQRIKMLAELMKLRQACCHPKLVLAETDIPSAKLAALDELLTELKINQHKALIFSQFVGHLQLIKRHLDARGFSYQYLDGATPQKERQKRVNAFQSGEGDVFLISLKAGGFGLNLTAADYVIHMDPWWNPAVEDQASDRAHRMGQVRPVTIYRLIAQNTIEEKIVALHKHKRDLADTLLEGNETATKLSVEDMLNLLKETF